MEMPLAVANFFVKKSFDTGKELTPMKLIKLVYIAHGWHLGLGMGPLLTEPPLAWKYGPVVDSVYYSFRDFGNSQITKMATIPAGNGKTVVPAVNESELEFLDKVWDVYKDFNGLQLSSLTHEPGTPWHRVWHQMGGKEQRPSLIIPNDIIEAHYKQKIASNKTKSLPLVNA